MQVDVHNNLGDLWRAQGPVGRSAAQQCYMEALKLDQQHAPAWRGLGDLLREAGDCQQAVACYQVGLPAATHPQHLYESDSGLFKPIRVSSFI
jgi:tetratricopeptide (TPR) repeat protein